MALVIMEKDKKFYKPRLRFRIGCNLCLFIVWILHLNEYKLRLMMYVVEKTMHYPHIAPNIPIHWVFNDIENKYHKLHMHEVVHQKPKLPNIIMIIADDLGINDLYNDHYAFTSNIRSIGEEGAVFYNAYAGHATCAPSRASLMTGRFPTRFGFEYTPVPAMMAHMLGTPNEDKNMSHAQNIVHADKLREIPDMDEMVVPVDEVFLPQALQSVGYRTFLFGKWHLGSTEASKPINRGFNHTLGFLMGASHYASPGDPHVEYSKITGLKFDQLLWKKLPYAVSYNDGPLFTPDKYMTDYLAEEAAAAILACRGIGADHSIPFFMELAFNAPHNPLVALQSDYTNPLLSHIQSHRARIYAAMILALDRGVETILTAVDAIGETDNTIVIFTSDNGGADYIGLYNINKPYRGWKATLFEGGLRVPLFVKWPKMIAPLTTSDATVAHVDLFATAVAAANVKRKNFVKPGADIDGLNLLCVLNTTGCRGSSQTEGHPYLFWRSGHYKALRFFDWKIQLSMLPYKIRLYDLRSDPTESTNLAEDISVDVLRVWAENNCFEEPRDGVAVYTPNNSGDSGTIHTSTNYAMSTMGFSPLRREEDDEEDESGKFARWLYSSRARVDALGHVDSSTSLLGRLQLSCRLLTVLDRIDDGQVEPLWPSVSETVVRIDEPSFLEDTTDGWNARMGEEYIYWPN